MVLMKCDNTVSLGSLLFSHLNTNQLNTTMDNKLNKKERQECYEVAYYVMKFHDEAKKELTLDQYLDKFEYGAIPGFCFLLNCILNTMKCGNEYYVYGEFQDLFPELYKHKPSKFPIEGRDYWFERFELKPRIAILENILVNEFQVDVKTIKINDDYLYLLSYNHVTLSDVTTSFKGNQIEFCANGVIFSAYARNLQCHLGYDPAGYGFNDFVILNSKTYWFCRRSCD